MLNELFPTLTLFFILMLCVSIYLVWREVKAQSQFYHGESFHDELQLALSELSQCRRYINELEYQIDQYRAKEKATDAGE